MGTMPRMVASEVIKIGRKRTLHDGPPPLECFPSSCNRLREFND